MEKNEHLYESLLVDTKEGIQCKVYANSHPEGKIIVKPKYIPVDMANFVGLKKRFIFSKAMFRFNLFNDKETVEKNLEEIKEKFPNYYFKDKNHSNWFLVVPKEDIKTVHDPKKGVQELMKVPEKDLDTYLTAVRGIIDLISKSGIPLEKIGINHSTLMCNYTPGKSDIDIVIYGKDNGWKVINYLSNTEDSRLKWKTEEDWRKYYKDRVVSKVYSEEEYVANMVQKKDDGLFDGNVFSIFVVEEPNEVWYSWKDEHKPLATIKFQGKVTEDYNSIVRPGYYGLEETKILEGYENIPIKRVVTWSRPFVLQAKKGEEVEGIGLLEEVKTSSGVFNQVVIGYFDTYTSERGEKEYIKKLVK